MIPPDLMGAVTPEMDDAPQAADGLDPNDPAAIVDAAVESGVATDERPITDTPPDLGALVKDWWSRTSETADFSAAVDQTARDKLTLEGGTDEEKGDAAEVTIQHVYRNAVQTVAQVMPELTGYRWKPREEVEPLPGTPTPPEVADRRRQQEGLAAVTTTLFRRFGEMGNFQEKTEAWVQDSVHFRLAIFKVWFQRELSTDTISETRLPDEQDLIARSRMLIEEYDRGEFTKSDGRYAEMKNCLASIGKTELDIKRGLVVEDIDIRQYRCDPAVKHPAYIDTARWERHDVLMTRDEVLSKWAQINPDDLLKAAVYAVDETGRAVKRDREDKTSTTREVTTLHHTADTRPRMDDWMLCAEIYDYQSNTRLVLVEGLEYPTVMEPLVNQPSGMSPFVVLVENPKTGSFYGYSDTELQAKSQRQLNRMRSQEEDQRRNAQPRWVANIGAFADPGDLDRIEKALPNSITGIKIQSGKDLASELVPLVGNHEFVTNEHDGLKHTQEMRKMAMMPEQATGELGNAQFAEEVKVSSQGMNALAKYRQSRITRALKVVANKSAQLILFNVNMEMAIDLAGPMAQYYYLQTPADRKQIYDSLVIEVEVAIDKQVDAAKKAAQLGTLIESFKNANIRFDEEIAGNLLVKYMGFGDEARGLVKSDPNALVGRLVEAMQKDPGAMAPEAVMALIQLGQQAQQLAMQMAQQQQAQQIQQQQLQSAGMVPAQGA